MSQRPGSGSTAKAEYYAKQGLSPGSIRRMVKWEFGCCPSDARINEFVTAEAKRRERFKRGPKVKPQW